MKKFLRLLTGIVLCFIITAAVLFLTKRDTEAATTVTTWAQLEAAFTDSETTITLGANITVPAGKSISFEGRAVTINGNGKTITVATGQAVSTKVVFYVQTGGSLTLNNVNFNGNGLYGCAVWCYPNSTKLTVNGGTYQNFDSFAINVVGAKDAVITGGTFKNNGKNVLVENVGHPNVCLSLTGTGTVSGGTFSGGGSAGLQIGSYSSSSKATFNISGVTCTGNTTVGLSTNNLGACAPVTINISGGSFSGNTMHGINVFPNVTVNMTGGTVAGNTSMGICVAGGTLNVKGAKETSVMITGNKYGVYDTKETNNGTTYYGTANIYGATINANKTYGIYVNEGTKCTLSAPSLVTGSTYNIYTYGQMTVKGGTVSSATSNGIRVTSTGKLVMSGGSIKDSGSYGVCVNSGGTCSMSGGSITGNGSYGLYNAGSSSITGGNVENNSGAYGDVCQNGTLTLLGTYDGRSSVKGYVYLAADSRYVSTLYSTTTINVRPNSYTDGRLVIRTYAPSFATTQAGGTLYPKEGWRMVVSGSDVVLSNKYTVTCIDVVRSTSGTELGRSTWSAEYGTTASGATAGSDTTTSAYYEGYYYTRCSEATVTGDDTTVYRYFMPQKYTVTCIDVAESLGGTTLGSSTKSVYYGMTVSGSDFGSDLNDPPKMVHRSTKYMVIQQKLLINRSKITVSVSHQILPLNLPRKRLPT